MQNHFEHGAVDRVIRPIEHQRPHHFIGLAKTVDPALTLLVTGRIPDQVVVHHRVEDVLQIDALAEAVGRHEYRHAMCVLLIADQTLHTLLAFRRGEFTGDRGHHGGLGGKAFAQLGRNIVGGGDVATKNHRPEPLGHELCHLTYEYGEFRIFYRASQPFGPLDQPAEGGGVSRGDLRLCSGAGRHGFINVEFVVRGAVEHSLGPDALNLGDLLCFAQPAQGVEAGTERHGRGRRAAAHAT